MKLHTLNWYKGWPWEVLASW